MGSEWTEMPLEEAMDAIIDYRGKTPTKTTSGIPLITAKIVKNGRIEPTQEYIAEADYDSWMRRGIPQKGDVVLTTEAPLGEVAQLNGDKIALAQRIITLRGKAGLLDSDFLKFLLQSNSVQHQLDGRASGTTVSGIKQSELRQILLSFPPLPEQKAIAHILGSLDDKIELNRRMNATLEGMAQALFKSWFVDFDPVIDNALAAGNPIPDELADRAEVRRQALADGTANREAAKPFPAAFQKTESMGWIPEGWKVKSIAEIAKKIGMGPFGSRITRDNFKDEGVPIIRGGNLTNGFVDKDFVYLTEDKATELKSSNVFPDDIIFTHRGTIGQVGIIPKTSKHPRYVVSQSQMFLRINQEITSAAYAFNYFKSGSGMERLLGFASQVGVPAIARPTNSLKSLPILVPEQKAVEAFDVQNTSYTNRMNACDEQMETHFKLRDTLLPKLISGELYLSDTKKFTKDTQDANRVD